MITERGKRALEDPKVEINNAYLKQFEEFNAFKEQKNEIQPNPTLSETTCEDDITPDETLRAAYKQINNALADEILIRTRQVTPHF